MYKIILPPLGEDIKKATLVCWHFSVGDHIAEDDDIAEVVTDKATFNIPVGKSGVVKEYLVEEDQEINVGEAFVVIG